MIIAVANQKGGQGKSTTAQAIVTGAQLKGKKALAIDLDPQGNLTFSMNGNGGDMGSYELMTGTAAAQIIQKTSQGDIIPASLALASTDTTFTGEDRIKALQNAIKPLKKKYDVIVIDCPPTLNTLLINALAAADKVVIPLTADIYALQGLYLLAQTIHDAQTVNKKLEIGGVVFTRHSTRTILARDLTDVIIDKCKELSIPVYNSTISESVAIREAQTQRQSIYEYAPKSKPAIEYGQLLTEIGI